MVLSSASHSVPHTSIPSLLLYVLSVEVTLVREIGIQIVLGEAIEKRAVNYTLVIGMQKRHSLCDPEDVEHK